MADPLSRISDEFAPAKSNYFDKGQASTLLARYGNANREAASARSLGAAAARNQAFEQNEVQTRAMQARMERDELLKTREDREWEEKTQADELRSQFLSDFDKNMKPEDPEYNSKLVGFLAEAPASLQKDPVFMGIVGIRNKQADEYLQQRNRESEIQMRQQNTLEAIRERAKNDDTLKYLKPERLANPPLTSGGEIDYLRLGMFAKQDEMEAKLAADEKKVGFRKDAAIDILKLKEGTADEKVRFADVEKFVINDSTAFPSRVDAVAQVWKAQKKNKDTPLKPEYLESDMPEEYAAAVEWDKKKFENEVLTAREQTWDEYKSFNGPDGKPAKLSPAAVESRRKLWEAAQVSDPAKDEVTETVTETVTEKPASVTEKPAPSAPTPKKVRGGYEYWIEDGVVKKQKVAQ